MSNSPTPLTPSQEMALNQIREGVDEDDGAITPETAVDLVTADNFERPEAYDLIDQLLLKGYLYESAGGLRVTD